MVLLSAVHRWCGALIGLLLTLLGLSGAILVWEGSWVSVAGAGDPISGDAGAIAAVAAAAEARGEPTLITFASDEIGLHQVAFAGGGGAYVRQDGTVAAQWASQWERPELWLFDLHHHLFAGHIGETVAGVAGIAGLMFVVTGLILWWRSRRSFAPRLLPKRFAPGPIVSHHRDLGVIAAPLLILSMVTGVMMLFQPVRTALLGSEVRPQTVIQLPPGQDVAAAIRSAAALFPEAELRRVAWPAKPGDPIAVRLRQPFEWTPNGRTFVKIGADGRTVVEDAAAANASAGVIETLYPVHSAKVGGIAWKLAMTASGLALALLGSLATWSFWARRSGKKRRRPAVRVSSVPA